MTDNLIHLDQHRPAPPQPDNVSLFFNGLIEGVTHLAEERRARQSEPRKDNVRRIFDGLVSTVDYLIETKEKEERPS